MDLIHLHSKAKKDILLLKKENPKLSTKIWELIFDIDKHPFSGIGKPEALKGDMQGW